VTVNSARILLLLLGSPNYVYANAAAANTHKNKQQPIPAFPDFSLVLSTTHNNVIQLR